MKNSPLLFLFLLNLVFSCTLHQESKIKGDLLIFGGSIYTMDDEKKKVEAVVVKADTFVFVGSMEKAKSFVGEGTKKIDLKGMTLVPGLIEGHAHIMGIGYNLLNIDLREAKSYQEVIDLVAERASQVPEGTWIQGRGWHQDKWVEQPEMTNGFPTHDALSKSIPNHPVYLKHASGHAALANQKALELAGINKSTSQPDGGQIFKSLDGSPTGLLNETAQFLVSEIITKNTIESDRQALDSALAECFRNGITGFHQAGSGLNHIHLFKEYAKQGELKIRLYVMLSGREKDLLKAYFKKGIEENLYDNQLTVRSVKLYADGALGSRGAWLLEEYTDAPGIHGHNIMSMEDIEEITKRAYKSGFQVCVHAIGDRANREVLDIYEKTFNLYPEEALREHRFRIEHAQHFHPDDIPRLANMGIIPAMQAIHMSSDRPWAIERLGEERIASGAYMWQTLLESGAKIVNGTDAPVEPLNPIASFFASVSRKTLKGTPSGGYEPAEKMTREQALKSYTLDAAYGAFREDKKGSIKVGKWADMTVFDKDLMTIAEDQILDTKVKMTIIAGEIVFEED